MSIRRIDPLAKPEIYDSALRWLVPSDTDPHECYLVDLGSFRGNGECQCKNFEVARRPFIVRGKTPEWATENDLPDVNVPKIVLKEGQRVEDALRCKHIKNAILSYADLSIQAQSASEAAHGVVPES